MSALTCLVCRSANAKYFLANSQVAITPTDIASKVLKKSQ